VLDAAAQTTSFSTPAQGHAATAAEVVEESPPLETLSAQPAAPTQPVGSAGRLISTVIIDPGHGGSDAGCEGAAGLRESALALALAQRLQREITSDGAMKAVLTRDKDRAVARNERVGSANSNKGDLFLSIHAGAGFAAAAHGFEIFCQPIPQAAPDGSAAPPTPSGYAEDSLAIAQCIAPALAEATEAKNRGVRFIPCQVLKDVSMPSLLIEVGFLSNPNEEKLLQSEGYLDKIAQGIATGLKNYAARKSQAGGTP
jgi:N-acetylmuramoyl-L-alanine amidase